MVLFQPSYFLGKKVTVFGCGRSGVASSLLLSCLGAEVLITDKKNALALKEEIALLSKEGVKFEMGGHTKDALLGSSLIVLSPGVPPSLPILEEAKKEGIPIISEIELGYQLLEGVFVIGITGTNGKTTTTALIGELLRQDKREVYVCGNIGTPVTEVVKKGVGKSAFLVVELSSFQLEGIVEFRPNISVFLNLTPDHLDRYNTMQAYAKAKERIFLNQTEEDFSVLNADSSSVMSLNHGKAKSIFFSQKPLKEGVFVKEELIYAKLDDREGVICNLKDIRLKGRHNLENVLAACCVGMILGITPEVIKETISTFSPLDHRLKEVAEIEGVVFINDSKATNVSSMLSALESFDSPVILIAGGKDKGGDFSVLNPYMEEKIKALIVLGEAKERIKACIKKKEKLLDAKDIKEAVELAYEVSLCGDVVLFSPGCASFDMFLNFEERGWAFVEAVLNLRNKH